MREFMVEAAAEADDELMDSYLEEGDLSEEKLSEDCVLRTLAIDIVPVLGGSAFKNKGVQAMLGCRCRLLAVARRSESYRRYTRSTVRPS